MRLLASVMQYYPYVVHPITVLGISILVLIYYEWNRQNIARSILWRRIGTFLIAGFSSLVPTVMFFLLTGAKPMAATRGNDWRMDALVAVGLFIVAGMMWYLWGRLHWGVIVPGAMQALFAVTVPYIALSPLWNVSGHVIITLMPILYLTLVDRRFWPLLVIPIFTVVNRIYLNAHTWAQAIAGFLISTVIVIVLYWLQTDGSLRQAPKSTTI